MAKTRRHKNNRPLVKSRKGKKSRVNRKTKVRRRKALGKRTRRGGLGWKRTAEKLRDDAKKLRDKAEDLREEAKDLREGGDKYYLKQAIDGVKGEPGLKGSLNFPPGEQHDKKYNFDNELSDDEKNTVINNLLNRAKEQKEAALEREHEVNNEIDQNIKITDQNDRTKKALELAEKKRVIETRIQKINNNTDKVKEAIKRKMRDLKKAEKAEKAAEKADAAAEKAEKAAAEKAENAATAKSTKSMKTVAKSEPAKVKTKKPGLSKRFSFSRKVAKLPWSRKSRKSRKSTSAAPVAPTVPDEDLIDTVKTINNKHINTEWKGVNGGKFPMIQLRWQLINFNGADIKEYFVTDDHIPPNEIGRAHV